MKSVSNEYKNGICKFGRELDSKVSYTKDGVLVELGSDVLNSITPHFESDILKSTMKSLEIDSNVEIPIGTILKYEFGLKVGNSYEYINYGNYIVKEAEKQEDLGSWKIICYDKMLYAMKDYENIGVQYPITIRNYINALCTYLGLTFKNRNDEFVNYDKVINNELYLDSEGGSLDYTFRDVFDELAQATGSTICINETDDELEIRYINDIINDTETVEGSNINITDNVGDNIIGYDLQGNTQQTGTPTLDSPVPIQTVTGRQVVSDRYVNIFDFSVGGTAGQYLTNTGEVATGTDNLRYSDYIELTQNTPYLYFGGIDPTYLLNAPAICFYDSTKTFISGESYLNRLSGSFAVPTGAKYIRTSYRTFYTSFQLKEEKQYEINLGKNILDLSSITSGENQGTIYSNNNGTITLNGTATANNLITSHSSTTGILLTAGTYTLSTNNEVAGSSSNYIRLCTLNGTAVSGTGVYLNTINNKITFTLSEDTKVRFQIRTGSGTQYNDYVIKPQLEKGSQASSFSPYFTPIELNDEDSIKRSTGKNLFDKNSTGIIANSYIDVNGNIVGNNPFDITDYIRVEQNGKYTYFGITTPGTAPYSAYYDKNKQFISSFKQAIGTNTITVPNNAYYVRFSIKNQNQDDRQTFMIEKGSTATSYEPFLPKGTWYVEKQIGNVIYNGTESGNWSKSTSGGFTRFASPNISNVRYVTSRSQILSNYFHYVSSGNEVGAGFIYAQQFFAYPNQTITTESDFRTWLGTHNTKVIYPLATPTYIEITNEELLGQLNAVANLKPFKGINKIVISSMDLASPIKLTYITEYEQIDERYLKDVNVDFGEKYGPVNSIVLSRASESDSVYLRDEESIEQNGLCEIKIKENQIMNFNDRSDYLPALLNQLNGLEYYINDFSSTGITYLELCDKYRIKIDDNTYPCIMFNDEPNITQGLEEIIHTDMPEDSETDYKKADKTDRKINQTYIIADKQKGQIEALTSRTDVLEDTTGNMYTKDQVNILVQNAETGLTNTFSEAGGNNILRNTGLWFESSDINNPYEFWVGNVVRQKEDKASNFNALLLQNNTLYQDQTVPSGKYTLSFKYKKLIQLATVKCKINDTEYTLTETEDTEFTQTIEVNTGHIKIQFISDTDNSCEIYDLMLNAGEVSLAYSQNQNETTTDTVNISKGITITSSDSDTTFKADADGIRTFDKSGNRLTEFTDTGMINKTQTIEDEATIVGILIQKVGNHTWFTKI